MAMGTESRVSCQSFSFAKPKFWHKVKKKKKKRRRDWALQIKISWPVLSMGNAAWRKSGKLPSSIPTAQGAQRGQKTIAHEVGVSLEDNPECQQLSGLWPSGLGSGLSAQPHREQDFLLYLFWKTQGGAEAHCTSPSLIRPSGWPNVDYQNMGQNRRIQGSVLLKLLF